MPEDLNLTHPWLVAIWPGMGHVALNAGYYLLARLEMNLVAEFEANDLFDVDHVEVKAGLIQEGSRPRNRFFVWTDPEHKHDIVIFLGEAQPPVGKYVFCKKLVEFARELGIERIYTFAAMATQMHPSQPCRVFGAATDQESLEELKRLELEILEDGHIAGLNGVLLGAAVESGLHGACLLGEMPHIFSQLPFPKASLAILEVFTTITGLEIDFEELIGQAKAMEEQLGEILSRMEESYGEQFPGAPGAEEQYESVEEEPLSGEEKERIEELFELAKNDRRKAFELKQELDRLEAFRDYEDRFLDLFKKP